MAGAAGMRGRGSLLEAILDNRIAHAGLPPAVPEYYFALPRKWRFDRAYPSCRLAVEVEGGTWSGGRHVRGNGFEADCAKYDHAVLLGWRVLRFTGRMIEDGTAVAMLREALGGAAEAG